MRNASRIVTRVIVGLAALCLLAAGLVYAMQEKRIQPEPFNLSELKRLGNLDELRPHMRRLVEALKAGELVGAPYESFRADLELADDVRNRPRIIGYSFYVHPEIKEQEGSPGLYIFVQKKFGHVDRAVVAVPEW